nr:hypothetical protein [Oceanococcus sp. HetDA_MAG_MS8]
MDKRIPRKKRMRASDSPLASKFEAELLRVMAEFKETHEFRHAQTKGNEREKPVRRLFERLLPEPYTAVGAEIIDVSGARSHQHDVVIFNSHKNPAFIDGESALLPAEAALIVVEVKSTLTSEELRKSFVSANQLKRLRPLGRPVERKLILRGNDPKGFRYFYSVFGFGSDLTADRWLEKEYQRIERIRTANRYKSHPIDRVYVADRGVIMPGEARGRAETDCSGGALMDFVIHSINFCLREDTRRPPVDYVNYTKASRGAWRDLSS